MGWGTHRWGSVSRIRGSCSAIGWRACIACWSSSGPWNTPLKSKSQGRRAARRAVGEPARSKRSSSPGTLDLVAAAPRIVTAQELDDMTPNERVAVFDERIVRNLDDLPSEFRARVEARARQLAEELRPSPSE